MKKLLHTEKYFRNLNKSNRSQIVFTMHRLIWQDLKSSSHKRTLREIDFSLLSNVKEFDLANNFSFDYEPKEI